MKKRKNDINLLNYLSNKRVRLRGFVGYSGFYGGEVMTTICDDFGLTVYMRLKIKNPRILTLESAVFSPPTLFSFKKENIETNITKSFSDLIDGLIRLKWFKKMKIYLQEFEIQTDMSIKPIVDELDLKSMIENNIISGGFVEFI